MESPFPRRIRSAPPRGGALLVAMIVLAVLAMLVGAGFRLAQQEAVSVNRRISYQMLSACADAAQRKLWADVAAFGTGTGAMIPPTVVPGTNSHLQIGHFDDSAVVASVALDDRGLMVLAPAAAAGGITSNDQTNTIRVAGFFGQPHLLVAHCRDDRGRSYEVELLVRFGL